MQDHTASDERLQAAKALIDQCLTDWTERFTEGIMGNEVIVKTDVDPEQVSKIVRALADEFLTTKLPALNLAENC